MEQFDAIIIEKLRSMARSGQSPSQVFKTLKRLLGPEMHILTIIHYIQHAFCLNLSEVKPFVALSGAGTREVHDEAFLDELVVPSIAKHQQEWDIAKPGEPGA